MLIVEGGLVKSIGKAGLWLMVKGALARFVHKIVVPVVGQPFALRKRGRQIPGFGGLR